MRMLEKVGLPPKPALKGNEWVLDASHCQGCSSAFSFFNRKHHCRRCGGIFCGNCTQQRMTLRGQGEGPVRICEPCKKLEDAARFETRYGHRNKAPKGNSKSNDMESDLLLKELLGHESNPPEKTELLNEVSELIAPRNIASTSMGQLVGMEKAGNDGNQSTPMTPEMLLLQAQEEKKQWLALKREGKGEEALQAFKRGRELERQAENLKVSLRRSQRKAVSSTVRKEKHEEVSKSERRQKTGELTSRNTEGKADDGIGPTKSKRAVSKEPEEKDNLMDALKDMGWSDADLQDAGRKHSKAKTVESELAELAAAVHQGEGNNRQGATSSMEVLAHKRRALALKREGHLAEAKEELKKAKLMERQLEEQHIFGGEGEGEGEESDDDLTALIRGLDKENTTDTFGSVDLDVSMFGDIGNFDHDDDDEGMEVTDLDMDDPEMVAALRSMGWEEEATAMEKSITRTSAKPSVAKHGGRTPFHGGAKGQKPAGEDTEFLDNMEESLDNVETTEDDMEDPYFLSALKAMGFEEEKPSKLMQPIIASIPKPYEKKSLQQQILFLKREALVLKRSGKLQEAKEELRRAKQLEKELQEFQSQHTEEDVLAAFSLQQEAHGTEAEVIALPGDLHAFDDDAHTDNVDVTEEDMGDPELARTLKSLGWQDDHETEGSADTEKEVDESSEQLFIASHQTKTRSELQKELLGFKRAALKLRREGRVEEAEDELRKSHMLERFMEESGSAPVPKQGKHTYEQKVDGFINSEKKDKVSDGDMEDPTMLASLQSSGWNEPNKDVKRKQSSILSSSTLATPTITEKPSGDRVGFEDMTHGKTSHFGRENNSGSDIRSQQPFTLSKVRADSSFGLGNMQPPDSGKEILNIEGDKLSSTTVGVGFGGSLGSIGAEKGKDKSDMPEARTLSPRRNITKLTDVEVRNMLSQDSVREPPLNPLMPPHIVKGNNIGSVKSTATMVPSSVQALQQEILSMKRKALALKREGRQLEAKEQLREAKILEKKLAFEQSQSENPVMEEGDLPGRKEALLADTKVASSKQVHISGTSVVASSSVAAQKHAAGKDRLKLQQESLAHKRKALGLRREGKTEEADVEFELAKSIERQMEELGENAGHSAMPPSYSGDDVGSVDDIFDPQLLAALKGLGWKDTDILQPTPKVGQEGIEKAQMGNRGKATDAVSSTIIRVQQNDEKEQLEEKIRSEKVRAVQLKRSGRQLEALDVLRGAKQLERKLQSLS